LLEDFTAEVQAGLAPLLNGVYEDVEQLDGEIALVAGMLVDAAERHLPLVHPRRPTRWRDDTLSCLCTQSRAARAAWKEAGCPLEGPLYEEKGRLRRAVRRRVRFCAARAERLRIQRRDRMFASGNRFRFRTPRQRKRCCKLVVDGKVVSNPEVLIGEWVEHFRELAKSRRDGTSGLEELQQKVDDLALESLGNEDMLLDVPFSAEEVAAAVGRLKRGKAAGPDGLMAEHLKAGGEGMVIWLLNVLNAVVELEAVPDILKRGVVVPVYKGGGKDPLRVDSYRGVTLSSIVAKVLEFLCLDRLQMVFL